jgi:hypothetical protein
MLGFRDLKKKCKWDHWNTSNTYKWNNLVSLTKTSWQYTINNNKQITRVIQQETVEVTELNSKILHPFPANRRSTLFIEFNSKILHPFPTNSRSTQYAVYWIQQ